MAKPSYWDKFFNSKKSDKISFNTEDTSNGGEKVYQLTKLGEEMRKEFRRPLADLSKEINDAFSYLKDTIKDNADALKKTREESSKSMLGKIKGEFQKDLGQIKENFLKSLGLGSALGRSSNRSQKREEESLFRKWEKLTGNKSTMAKSGAGAGADKEFTRYTKEVLGERYLRSIDNNLGKLTNHIISPMSTQKFGDIKEAKEDKGTLGEAFGGIFSNIFNGSKKLFTRLFGFLTPLLGKLLKGLGSGFAKILPKLGNLGKTALKFLPRALGPIASLGFAGYDAFKGTKNTQQWLGDRALDGDGNVKTSAKAVSGVAGFLGGTDSGWSGAVGGALKGAGLGSFFGPIGIAVGTAVGGVLGAVGGERIANFFMDIGEKTSKLAGDVKKKTIEIWGDVKSFASNTWSSVKETSSKVATSVATFVTSSWDKLKDKSKEVWESTKDISSKAYNSTKAFVSKTVTNTKDLVVKGFNTYTGHLSKSWTTIKDLSSKALGVVSSTLANGWGMIKNGFANVKNFVVDGVANAKSMVTDFLGMSQPSDASKLATSNVKNVAPARTFANTISRTLEHVKALSNELGGTTDKNAISLSEDTIIRLSTILVSAMQSVNLMVATDESAPIVAPSDDSTIKAMGYPLGI